MTTTLASHRLHGSGTAPGTCGELAQGVLPDGRRFHVTCPIDRVAAVQVELEPATTLTTHGLGPQASKIDAALRATAALLDLSPARIDVQHTSSLATGKGMASSTADIIAASRALASASGRSLSPEALGALAAGIESSDGLMYDGICAVQHRTGEVLRHWSWWPRFAIVMAIPPATIDTASVRFDGQDRLAREYAAMLDELDAAVEARDAARFGAVASRSAELNEAFLPNPVRAPLADRAPELGALGVCVGHTGTIAGLLFTADPAGRAAAEAAATELRVTLPRSVAIDIALTPASPR